MKKHQGILPEKKVFVRKEGKYVLVLLALVGIFSAGVLLRSSKAEVVNGRVVVRPTAINEYLANPGIGWQRTYGQNTGPEEKVAYLRWTEGWASFNPSAGVYDWTKIDQALSGAKSKGKQISFRVYTMRSTYRGEVGHRIPQWVMNDGAKLLASGEIDYSNAMYQKHWATFVDAMRQRYDGNPDIAYIDISGYGNYNEWSWQDQTDFEDDWRNPTTLDGNARKRLADMFLGGSGTVKVRQSNGTEANVSYSYPGFTKTQLIMPNAGIRQSTWYALEKRKDVGFRHDCLGRAGVNDFDNLGAELFSLWKTAPIAFEFCSSNNDVSMVRAQQLNDKMHGSLIHDNDVATDPAIPNILKMSGYRYVLNEASYEAIAKQASTINIQMKWANIGTAKAYEKMGQNFELRASLHRSDGTLAHEWNLASTVNNWLPADTFGGNPPLQTVTGTLTVPAGLPAGTYGVRTSIMDKRTGKPINLAIAGRQADGRYALSTIVIESGSVPTTKPGDTDGDNDVDALDLSVILRNYGKTVITGTQGDLSGDGKVNGLDLSEVLSNYGVRKSSTIMPQAIKI